MRQHLLRAGSEQGEYEMGEVGYRLKAIKPEGKKEGEMI